MPEPTPPAWALIVHGGAKIIASDQAAAHTAGVLAAVERAGALLAAGGTALDAVETAVRLLEGDPTFNAGFGAVLNSDGVVELDASIMDGRTLGIGAVGAVQGVRHPISVARMMLPHTAILLVGEGALRFAKENGGEVCPPEQMIAPGSPGAREPDTVGCVALDRAGHIACGLSTGGLTGKRPGRVGDSPLPGCGFYADDDRGAAAFSGDGESIARVTLAARVMEGLQGAGPQRALNDALRALERVGGEAGGIVLDRRGRFGCAHTSRNFAVAGASAQARPRAGIDAAALGDLIEND